MFGTGTELLRDDVDVNPPPADGGSSKRTRMKLEGVRCMHPGCGREAFSRFRNTGPWCYAHHKQLDRQARRAEKEGTVFRPETVQTEDLRKVATEPEDKRIELSRVRIPPEIWGDLWWEARKRGISTYALVTEILETRYATRIQSGEQPLSPDTLKGMALAAQDFRKKGPSEE